MPLQGGTERADDTTLMTSLLSALVRERAVDDAILVDGLAARSRSVRALALELALREPLVGAAPLLTHVLRDPADFDAVVRGLAGDPLLALARRPGGRFGDTGAGGPSVQKWFERSRVARIAGALRPAGDDGLGDLLRLCERLPGLFQLAATDSTCSLSNEHRERVAAAWSVWLERRSPRQIAIVPSYRCDRSCAYCFNRTRGAEMTLDSLRAVLDRVAPPEGLVRVNIFGGEPTLFGPLLEFTAELHRRGLSFFFSTHGVVDAERFDRIVAEPNLEMVTLHVDRPSNYRGDEHAVLIRNAAALRRRGVQIVLRYNVVDPSARDFGFLAPLLDAAPEAFFSFAVAFPSITGDNRHGALEELPRYAQKIVALVAFLVERPRAIPRIALAKPFPMCAFGDAELPALLSRVDYRNVCEIDRRRFSDQVQITPDLEAIPCMAVSAADLRLTELGPLDAMGRAFERLVGPIRDRPIATNCASCNLFLAGACQGACYAYAQLGAPDRSFGGARSAPRRLPLVP